MSEKSIFQILREKREEASKAARISESKKALVEKVRTNLKKTLAEKREGAKKGEWFGRKLTEKAKKTSATWSKKMTPTKIKPASGKLRGGKGAKTSESVTSFRDFVVNSKCKELTLLERVRIARKLLSLKAPASVLEGFSRGDYPRVAKFIKESSRKK
jgi:hypothetical protein